MKNAKNKKVLLVFGVFVVLLILAVGVIYFNKRSKEIPPVIEEEKITESKAEIKEQNDNKLSLVVNVVNVSEFTQNGLRYSVNLFKDNGLGKSSADFVDVKAYNDVFSLAKEESVNREFVYEAPSYLNGTYSLSVDILDGSGMTYRRLYAGSVSLNGTGGFVEILPESCLAFVENDKDNVFTLYNGIDIKKEEKLMLSCDVVNHFRNEISIMPSWESFYRNYALGKKVENEKNSYDSIKIASNETKKIVLEIPKVDKPQAYDVKLSFKQNEVINSNSIVLHYVLSGESATIQTVKLNKNNSYKSGETAKVTIFWSGSADNFEGSRLGGTVLKDATMEFSIKDKDDNDCLSTLEKISLGNVDTLEKEVEVSKNCVLPKVKVTIFDSEGNVLDENTFGGEVSADKVNKDSALFDKDNVLGKILSFGSNEVKASDPCASYAKSIGGYNCTYRGMGECICNISKCETKNSACGNYHYFCGKCSSSNANKWYPASAVGPTKPLCDSSYPGGGTSQTNISNPADVYFPVGKYGSVSSRVTWTCEGRYGYPGDSCWAVRIPPVVNGACSSSAKATYPATALGPDTPLCNTGSPSPATVLFPVGKYGSVSSRVTWTCNGSGGGTNATCSAARLSPPACNPASAKNDYPWNAVGPTTPLCSEGTSNPSTVKFPDGKYGADSKVTWTCSKGTSPNTTCSAQRQTICGTGAKTYSSSVVPAEWSSATAISGFFCQVGATLTPVSPLPVFPMPGQTTTWKCNDAKGVGTNCSAKNETSICGTGAKNFSNQYTTPTEWSNPSATYFCQTGYKLTPASPLPVFPLPSQATNWKCNDTNGVGNNCSAINSSSIPTCPAWDNTVMTKAQLEAKTETELCGSIGTLKKSTTRPTGIYMDDIYWKWECTLKDAASKGVDPNQVFAQCKAKNCLAGTTFNEELFVYFKVNGTVDPAKFFIDSQCPDLCCTYTNNSSKEEVKVGTCDGKNLKSGQIKVDGHPDEIKRMCRVNCKDGKCDETNKDLSIKCVCTARKCTAQGTCATTNVFASSKADANCSSECSSNSDCGGSGNTIESR